MSIISSWGRLSALPHQVIDLTDRDQVATHLANPRLGLPHGMGRSYGDACLNPDGILWKTIGLDHFIDFDPATGRLHCEAGVLLADIQRCMMPRGWMLAVTPGTQFVTVGGAIANDVHGKNHHVLGSFGDHVEALTLLRTDGEKIDCGPHLRPDWFAATVGGVGLTGVIVTAKLQLQRVPGPWLSAETLPFTHLQEFFDYADASEAAWQHTVAWLDCTSGSNGLFMRANPIDLPGRVMPRARQKTMPFVPPISLMNRFSVPLLNKAYFALKKRQAAATIVPYTSFFYPLDQVLHWNRLYGPQGFYQYQSVVPREVGHDAVQAMLVEIARAKQGSFLSVLKTFGDRQGVGMLSFPRPGVTLALDFPNKGIATLKLFDRLDAIVREAGGRLYLAKDARMPRDLFEAGYPRLKEFLNYRDPGISSGLSRRLMDY